MRRLHTLTVAAALPFNLTRLSAMIMPGSTPEMELHMNSILPIHLGWSTDDIDANDDMDVLSLAVDRLGLYLDQESETLVQVLNEAGYFRILGEIDGLSGLHLEPTCTDRDIAQLLLCVRKILVRALEEMATISVSTDRISSSNQDFDMRVSWVCARLRDIISTLDWALN
jgi:hypothetical protein